MSATLTPAVRAYLEEVRFAVLATIDPDGMPQQSTIWYELQGNEIVMNTKRGRKKDRNLVRDARCSVCIEDQYRWVALSGPVTLIADQTIAQRDIERIATRYHGAEGARQAMEGQFSREERVTIRLQIERAVWENID
jgi:PPOX class probable F420-dependent enzyme